MKKLTTIIMSLCLFSLLQAQTLVSSCENAIEVVSEFPGTSLAAGEYWFTAQTTALPLTLTYYPDIVEEANVEIWLDLTCEYDESGKGIYDDPNVESMIGMAGNYSLSFPMHSTLKPQTDESGRIYYSILFDRNYRDMLYDQGVTYAIPAFLKLKISTSGIVSIVSTSINTRCRDYVNDLAMNTSLLIVPEDSVNVYRWQLGEWADIRYRITWAGEGNLDLYTGKDCELEKGIRVRDHYTLPNDIIQMTPRLSQEWIKDIYATEMYIRLYAQTDGILTVSEYQLETKLISFNIEGIEAVIDHENKTITAVLPRGVVNNAAILKLYIQNAIVTYMYEGVESTSPSGYTYNSQCTTLSFNGEKYQLDITFAAEKGSTNANLSNIYIDGNELGGFAAGVIEYYDVEVNNDTPIVSAQVADETATLDITQATSVPGTATIVVTAEAGNTQTYTIHFITARSRNTLLSSITVDGEPLADFTPDNRYYRMYAMALPVVSATAQDPKSSISIDQAKGVPGFAQIFVTSEAGEVGTYTINFSIDPAILACTENSTPLTLNMPVAVSTSGEDVLRAPFGRGLDLDDSNWSGQRIAFRWSGDNDIIVYVGSSCLFDPAVKNKAFIDSVIISQPKGEERHIAYLTEKQTKEWGQRSIDGTLYLKVKTSKAGSLVAQTWTPNGNNNSTLIDINQEYYFPTGHTSDNLYKIYLPDWKERQIKLSWEGMENMTMYGAAKWEFRLTQSDPAMLRPDFPHQFSASDSWKWDEDGIDELILHTYMLGGGDFIYIRFITDGYAGTLTTEWAGGKPTRLDGVDMSNSTLTWTREGESIIIRSTIKQMVQVYTLQGMLVASEYITPDTPIILPCTSLPQGTTYIIRGEQQTGKIM